jgi:hypothetical protein
MRILSSFFILITLFGCKETNRDTTINKSSDDLILTSWSIVKSKDDSKPIQRHEAAFIKLDGKFYLLGGRGLRPVSIYNPQTGIWTKGAIPPIELHHFQPFIYQNRIYVIGALTGEWPNETPINNIYIYNPILDHWTIGDKIPEERRRGSTGAVIVDDKLYLMGGIKNGHIGDHKNWTDRYDLNTGVWKALSNAPRARDHFHSVYFNGKIYNIAGRNTGITEDPFGGTIDKIDLYNIEDDSWETLTNKLPTPRAGNAAIVYNGKIIIAGGESSSQERAHSEVDVLDPITKDFMTISKLEKGRHGTGLLEYKGNLYIASGCGNRGGEPELFSMEKSGN